MNESDLKWPEFYRAEDTLDFHAFEELDPYLIEQHLHTFLEDSYINSLEQVTIITGKGGVVKPTVYKLLERHNLVILFRQAPEHRGGAGAFEVYLKP